MPSVSILALSRYVLMTDTALVFVDTSTNGDKTNHTCFLFIFLFLFYFENDVHVFCFWIILCPQFKPRCTLLRCNSASLWEYLVEVLV